MPVTIGSNIASLRAQRQLASSTDSLGGIFERLASGQRINRASDDAAGLAIADSLRNDARLYNTAQRNINDGISLVNIVSGTLSNQKEILFRLAELAEQSANGVYSSEQRSALNEEYQALVKEFGRLAESTEFNGQQLLRADRDGNPSEFLLQAGIDGGLDSILQVTGADTGSLSGVIEVRQDIASNGDTLYTGTPDGNDDIDDINFYSLLVSATSTAEQLSEYSRGLYIEAETTDSNGDQRDLIILFAIGDVNDLGDNNVSVTIFGDEGEDQFETVDAVFNQGQTARDAGAIDYSLTFNNSATGTLSLDLSGLQIIDNADGSVRNSSIDFTGVDSVSRAQAAITVVANRIEELSEVQGRFGAVQSRLETASAVVGASNENSLAAESRIRDADIAFESSELIRNNILQQAAASVLAQANVQPQLALSLIG